MIIQRAMVVKLPVAMIQELDDFFEDSNLFQFSDLYGSPADQNGLTIGDYFHRYLAGVISELGTTHYWRAFEAVKYHEVKSQLDPIIGCYVSELYKYRMCFNELSPFFSIEFLDIGTILVKEEFGYVPYPSNHPDPAIRNHPDIHTATYFSIFYTGPGNQYLNGIPQGSIMV